MASRWSGPSFDPAEAARPRPDRAVDPAGYFNHVDASAKEKFVAIEKTKVRTGPYLPGGGLAMARPGGGEGYGGGGGLFVLVFVFVSW